MKCKWKMVLCGAAICFLVLLIWNGTTERRQVAAVRGLDWHEACIIHIFDYGLDDHWADVTDPTLQKAIFEGLKSLSYEGEPPSVGPYGGVHIAENTWHVKLYVPRSGWHSLVLQGEDMHGEPISWLQLEGGQAALVAGDDALLEAVQMAFAESGERQ